MGPATDDSIPYQLPLCSPSEAATLTTRIPTEVLVDAAAATAVRNQRVADFTTATDSAAHAASIASSAIEEEEEAAQAAQTAAEAALATAQAVIAEADAISSTA